MIPTSLMLSMAAAFSKVPLPSVLECVVMLIVFTAFVGMLLSVPGLPPFKEAQCPFGTSSPRPGPR